MAVMEENNVEILIAELSDCTVTSVYKPPSMKFSFTEPPNVRNKPVKFIIGDFNCHNNLRGYEDNNESRETVVEWMESDQLSLIHDTKLPL